MSNPVRLQLSRRKGFNLQVHSHQVNGLDAVNVARPSKWGNPFHITRFYHPGKTTLRQAAEDAVDAYREWVTPYAADIAADLRGKNLACWCKHGEPCHADVLLELANAPACEEAAP